MDLARYCAKHHITQDMLDNEQGLADPVLQAPTSIPMLVALRDPLLHPSLVLEEKRSWKTPQGI